MDRRAFLSTLLATAGGLVLPETRRVYSFPSAPSIWEPMTEIVVYAKTAGHTLKLKDYHGQVHVPVSATRATDWGDERLVFRVPRSAEYSVLVTGPTPLVSGVSVMLFNAERRS